MQRPPPLEFFGIRPHGPDAVALEITDRVRNPWGILHGGATAVLVDAGMSCFVRRRRGDDVAAACGQLALLGAKPKVKGFRAKEPS